MANQPPLFKMPAAARPKPKSQHVRLAYTKRELAQLLSVCEKQIERWERRKLIKALNRGVSRKKLYPAVFVDAFLTREGL